MRRVAVFGLVGLLLAAVSANAHYLFLLPAQDGQPVRVVWNDLPDVPTADTGASLDAAAGGRYSALDGQGKVTPVTPKPGGDGWLSFPDLPADARELTGTTEYGVVLRGQPEPTLVLHHARAVLTPFGSGSAPPKSEPGPAELTPVARPNGVAFRLALGGKKAAATDVLVLGPDEKRPRAVRTDAEGVTPTFDRAGRYAVRALVTEPKGGEFHGRKYQQVRHYCTLVVRYEPGR